MEGLLATVSPFTGIGVFVAIAVVVISLAVRSVRKSRDNLARLASDLGLSLLERPPVLGLFRSTPTIEGNLGGRSVRIYQFTTGTQKNRRTWSALSVGCANPHGFKLRLCLQNFLTELGEKFGMQDIKLGDPEFDAKFVVQTNDSSYVRAALLPEMRESLMRLWPAHAHGANLKIEDGAVVYADTTPFSDEKLLLRMKDLVNVLVVLAALPEVYSG